jgi:aryl-alcohol dehydrogenase-like predicted oxidoreductase
MMMLTRPIPNSREQLSVIGCGTYRGFDVSSQTAACARLHQVLAALFAAGGSVIDSSPMYGKAEAVAGDLLAESNAHTKAFIATKVWTRGREAGIAQMENSFKLLKTDKIDLMQIHNLLDWKIHLPTLRKWKEAGRIRYLGITHYTASAFADLEAVMRAEPLDFVQFNYSAVDRAAERRLLPLAAERGIAVLANCERLGRACVARPPAPRLGRGDRLHELVAALAQVRRQSPGDDLRNTRNRKSRAHGRQCAGWFGTHAR